MRSALIIILCLLFTSSLVSQELISVVGKGPYPDQSKVFFTAYEGFRTIDLGSVRVTANSHIDYFTDYHGFCVMSAEGLPSYPLILANDPTCIEWDSIPAFPCDDDNAFLYIYRTKMDSLASLVLRWQESGDSSERVKLGHIIDSSITFYRNRIVDASAVQAAILLQADLLVLQAGMIDNTALMGDHKAVIMEFITKNFDLLFRSDRLFRLSEAYTGMNARCFTSASSVSQACVYDAGEWISTLGSLMPERDIIDHFLISFSGEGEYEVVAQLLQANAGKFVCELYVGANKRPASMPYTFSIFVGPDLSRQYSLDQFSGVSKILALYAPDCPASVASIVALYGYVYQNQVRVPVILVPSGELDEPLKDIMAREAPFGMQTGMKLGSSLMMGAGVNQLPAFIILDKSNLLSNIFYTLEDVKNFLSKK